MDLKLINSYIKVNLKRFVEYRTSFFMGLATSAIGAIVYIFFWKIIFINFETINGWEVSHMFLFLGYLYFNYFLIGFLFNAIYGMDHVIRWGRLDKYLIKPRNTLELIRLNSMWFGSIDELIISIVMFGLAVHEGIQISLLSFSLGLVLTTFAAYIIYLMGTTFGMLSFWFGRGHLNYLFSSIVHNVGRFPIILFGPGLKFVFTFIIPVFFISTSSILVYTNPLNFITYFAYTLVIILFWKFVQLFVFKKGLERYESYGG